MSTPSLVAAPASPSPPPSEHLKTPFGRAIEVTTSFFLETLLPPLREDLDFQTFVEDMPTLKKLRLITKNGRLWGYDANPPSRHKGCKISPFCDLHSCATKLLKTVPGIESTTVLLNGRTKEWDLEKRAEDALPDAYLVLRTEGKAGKLMPVDWTSIAVSGAYYKSCSPVSSSAVRVL